MMMIGKPCNRTVLWRNPEFIRNLWVELSPFKLALIPVIFGGLIFVLSQFGHSHPGYPLQPAWNDNRNIARICTGIATWVFYIAAPFKAASSIREEIAQKTWDFQRMSSIDPWTLAIGKLLGATSYHWLITLFLLVVGIGFNMFAVPAPSSWASLFITPVLFVLCGYLGQSAAFLAMLHNIANRRGNIISAGLLGLIVAHCAFRFVTIGLNRDMFFDTGRLAQSFSNPSFGVMHWNGLTMPMVIFALWSLLYFLFWTQAGIYRSMMAEMQYRKTPVVWMVFLASFVVYCIGLVDQFYRPTGSFASPLTVGGLFDTVIIKAFVAFCILLLMTYSDGLGWAQRFGDYRRFWTAFARSDHHAMALTVPSWILTGTAALVCLGLVIISAYIWTPPDNFSKISCFALAIALLAVRDLFALHAIFLPGTTRHAKAAVLGYYTLFYLVLPAALRVRADNIPSFFLPTIYGHFLESVVPIFFQAVFAGLALWYAYDRNLARASREQTLENNQ